MKFFTKSISGPLFLLAAAGAAAARTVTVTNHCSYTVWPAMLTSGPNKPNHPTGWEAPPHSTEAFEVPDNWQAARIWARRGCDFSKGTGPDTCLSGGCIGGLECDPAIGGGVPPVSLAEFTLSAAEDSDWYNLSLVDGYNVPIKITPSEGCPTAECVADLNSECPAELKGATDDKGFTLGCKSACIANLDGNPANSPNCCSGDYGLPDTCPVSGVKHYDFFKSRCPEAYAYAYDEASGVLKTCPASKKANYAIVFCP